MPDFSTMYELYDPCTCMFFFRNKHIMIDLGERTFNPELLALVGQVFPLIARLSIEVSSPFDRPITMQARVIITRSTGPSMTSRYNSTLVHDSMYLTRALGHATTVQPFILFDIGYLLCAPCPAPLQEFIDIIETIYRGARKGRGLVVSPKDYSTKYRY